MSGLASSPTFPISELSPYHRSWVIKARVTTKALTRTFQRRGASNDGKLFSVELLDAEGGQIRATFFNEAVDTYENLVQQGQVYYFSGGNLRIADKRYNSSNHRYEISFDRNCNIEKASDDDAAIGNMRYEFVDLRALQSRDLPCNVDLCGVIQSVQEVAKITSKAGKELIKRDLVIADDTGYTLNISLWGEEAKRNDSDFQNNPVLALKGVRISDFNERSGSTISGSVLQINPEGVPEVTRLASWWAQGGRSQQLTALSTQRGAGGGARANAQAVTMAELRSLVDQVGEKPEVFQTVARLQRIQFKNREEKAKIYYTACAELKVNGLPCNRKILEDGTCPICEKQGKTNVRLIPRANFADSSDSVWMSTFDEAAQAVLGCSGEECRDRDKGGDQLEDFLQTKYNSAPFKLFLRARAEEYQGERRPRVDCISAQRVSYPEHGRQLLKEVMEAIAVH